MASVLGEVETNLQVAIARVIDCVLPCCRSLTVPGAVASAGCGAVDRGGSSAWR